MNEQNSLPSTFLNANHHRSTVLLILLALMFISPVSAIEIKGVMISDSIRTSNKHPELVLNGASIRRAYVFAEIYIGSLYLEEKISEPDAIFDNDGYKVMHFHMLRKVRGRSIANALKEAMQVNLSEEDILGFRKEVRTLRKFLDRKMHKGEVGFVEYIPGKGSRVVLADEVKGIIPGKDFFNALLSAWIGKEPVSQRMKAELLGKEYKKPMTALQKRRMEEF